MLNNTVKDILLDHLIKNNFEGLCHCESNCGCSIEDLLACGDDFSDCTPAYKRVLTPDEIEDGYEYVMAPNKNTNVK